MKITSQKTYPRYCLKPQWSPKLSINIKIDLSYPPLKKKNKKEFLTCSKIFQVKNLSGFKIHLLKVLKCNIFQFLCKNN